MQGYAGRTRIPGQVKILTPADLPQVHSGVPISYSSVLLLTSDCQHLAAKIGMTVSFASHLHVKLFVLTETPSAPRRVSSGVLTESSTLELRLTEDSPAHQTDPHEQTSQVSRPKQIFPQAGGSCPQKTCFQQVDFSRSFHMFIVLLSQQPLKDVLLLSIDWEAPWPDHAISTSLRLLLSLNLRKRVQD